MCVQVFPNTIAEGWELEWNKKQRHAIGTSIRAPCKFQQGDICAERRSADSNERIGGSHALSLPYIALALSPPLFVFVSFLLFQRHLVFALRKPGTSHLFLHQIVRVRFHVLIVT